MNLKIAPKTVRYRPASEEDCENLRRAGLPVAFEAISIGYEGGQFALIPLDESSLKNAQAIVALPELLSAAKEMLEAHTPSYSNKWEYEDGYGVSRRRDWREDQRVRNVLAGAIAKAEGAK